MTLIVRVARSFLNEEDGATMVEYALMVAFIALVCFTAVGNLGTAVNSKMSPVSATLAGS